MRYSSCDTFRLSMRLILALIPLHLLVYLGLSQPALGREAASIAGILQALIGYPAHLLKAVVGMTVFMPGLATTALYFALATLLLWPMAWLLRRVPQTLLWTLGAMPAFLLLVLAVYLIFWLAVLGGFFTPVEPNAPWLVATLTLSLMLPPAARVAHYLRLRQPELIRSDFARTGRAIGLSEVQVRHRVDRVALPEGLSLMAGEAFGIAVAVMLLEGLMQFPGLGLAVYNILASSFGNDTGLNLGTSLGGPLSASPGLLLLLLLAGGYAWLLEGLARRLDPRRRV